MWRVAFEQARARSFAPVKLTVVAQDAMPAGVAWSCPCAGWGNRKGCDLVAQFRLQHVVAAAPCQVDAWLLTGTDWNPPRGRSGTRTGGWAPVRFKSASQFS